MADTYTLNAKDIPGVTWTDDGDNTVEDAAVSITNVLAPTTADGVATKGYVDTSGLGADPVDATGATLALTQALHAGKIVTLNRAAGMAVTLPDATATGDVYKLTVATAFAGASTIKVPDAANTMIGNATLYANGGDTVVGFSAGATADTIDMLGTANSTGGLLGASYTLTDIAADLWMVEIVSDAAGTEATPFSATVS